MKITIKVTEEKGIIIGRTVRLFGKPRCAVALWNDSVVFADMNPETIQDLQAQIYTISEIREFLKEGSIDWLADIEKEGK